MSIDLAPAAAARGPNVRSGATATGGRMDLPRWAPVALVATLALVFLVHSSPWLAGPFGESHDGRNAAVWGLASRAVREQGPLASRFGGHSAPGFSYANHPPLIIAETAIAETVAGEHRVVTRAPAWVGSLVAVVLLVWLLRDAGLSLAAAATGVTVVFASPMFLVYGTMLDTPVTSLPFTLTVLLAWQRCRQGRPWPPWVSAACALLAALSGWQALTVTALAGGLLGVDAFRGRVHWRQVLPSVGGAAGGLTVTLLWARWVYGSLSPLFDQAGYRSGDIGWGQSFDRQLGSLWSLLPAGLVLGTIGGVLALGDRRLRPLLGLTVAAIIAYAAIFRGGAFVHDYWNYAILIPLSMGAAGGVDRLTTWVSSTRRTGARLGLAAASLGILVLSLGAVSPAEAIFRSGLGTARLARTAMQRVPPGGPVLAYLAVDRNQPHWIDYETGRPGLALSGRADLRRLAEQHPDFPVLMVLVKWPPDVSRRLSAGALQVDGPYALVPARTAAAETANAR